VSVKVDVEEEKKDESKAKQEEKPKRDLVGQY